MFKWLRKIKSDATALATVALVIVTMLLAVVSFMQFIVLRGQLHAFESQLLEMKADQRPWVQVELSLDNWNYVHNGTQWRADVQVTYKLKNTGKSPAVNVRHRAEIDRVLSISEHVDKQKTICNEIKQEDRNTNQDYSLWGSTLFPGQNIESRNKIIMWWIEDRQIGTSEVPTLYGCIDYKVAGGDEHHQTGFMYSIGKTGLKRYESIQIKIDPAIALPAGSLELFPLLDGFFAD